MKMRLEDIKEIKTLLIGLEGITNHKSTRERCEKSIHILEDYIYRFEQNKISIGDICIFKGYKSLARMAHKDISIEKCKCLSYNKVDDKYVFEHPNGEIRTVTPYDLYTYYSKF